MSDEKASNNKRIESTVESNTGGTDKKRGCVQITNPCFFVRAEATLVSNSSIGRDRTGYNPCDGHRMGLSVTYVNIHRPYLVEGYIHGKRMHS